MASIKPFLDKIRTAVYGKEVRGSLADGLDAVNKETEGATKISKETEHRQDAVEQQFDDVLSDWSDDKPTDNAETIASRTNRETNENYDTLGQRLDKENKKVTSQLAETMQRIDDTVILIKPSMTTQEIQNILNNSGTFKFVKGEYLLEFLTLYDEATCLDIQDDSEVFFEKGVTLKAPVNDLEYYKVINMEKKKNITLHDAVVFGDKHEHTAAEGEWGHGFVIRGSHKITLNDCSAYACWGDGLYIGPSTDYTVAFSSEIKANNFTSDDNRRQGISVTSVKGLRMTNLILKNTGGTDPSAGIDFEPNNNGNFLEDIVIENIYTENNRIGIDMHLNKLIGYNPKNISIIIDNHISAEDVIGANINCGLNKGTLTGKVIYNNHQYRYSNATPLQIEWYSDLLAVVEINKPVITEGNVRGSSANVTASAISLRNYDVKNRKIGNIVITDPDIYSTEYFPVRSLFVEADSDVENLSIINPIRLLDDRDLAIRYGRYRVTDDNNLLVYNSTNSMTNISNEYSKTYTNRGADKITRFNLSNEIVDGSPEISFECVENYRMDIYPDANSAIIPLSNAKGKALHMRRGARVTLKRLNSTTWQITNMIGEIELQT